MTVLLAVAALVVGAPLAAAALVTLASHREDMAHSLGGRPPGMLAAAARTLLCLRIGGSALQRRPPVLASETVLPRETVLSRKAVLPRETVLPRERDAEIHHSDDRTLTLPRT